MICDCSSDSRVSLSNGELVIKGIWVKNIFVNFISLWELFPCRFEKVKKLFYKTQIKSTFKVSTIYQSFLEQLDLILSDW